MRTFVRSFRVGWLRARFLRRIYNLQTFTILCFPETIILEEYDLLLVLVLRLWRIRKWTAMIIIMIESISATNLPFVRLFI